MKEVRGVEERTAEALRCAVRSKVCMTLTGGLDRQTIKDRHPLRSVEARGGAEELLGRRRRPVLSGALLMA
jgi:hypothetical protein